jgi:AraC family transcriptional regulator
MPTKIDLPEVLAHVKCADGLSVQLRRDPAGVLEIPEMENVIIAIHLGAPTRLECRRGGRRFVGTAVHGDIDIIPDHTPSRWEIFDAKDTALLLSLPKQLLRVIATECGADDVGMEIRNRFQIRDTQLEGLGWAIKDELDLGCPSGRLYLDGLGLAVASRLVTQYSSIAHGKLGVREGLSDRRLKQVLSFIEEHLADDLSLNRIADVAGISATHLKAVFRSSLGLPVHRYVIHRRVERAKTLLMGTDSTVTEIALATGFSHQSHMARHMRRILGVAPRAMRGSLLSHDSAVKI